ncbi:hypothetical protein HNY73_021160 [Argiope bruennichi]|uniref:Uncharacterized protein n=1 Tax=Argiope bruennichi TaxID=94029 RepID=A0A8T0EA45_ARGBR|nr:hypothetical protein HNY73_021160 [Argiope bruennichi]
MLKLTKILASLFYFPRSEGNNYPYRTQVISMGCSTNSPDSGMSNYSKRILIRHPRRTSLQRAPQLTLLQRIILSKATSDAVKGQFSSSQWSTETASSGKRFHDQRRVKLVLPA